MKISICLMIAAMTGALAACTVVNTQVQNKQLSEMSFRQLIRQTGDFIGEAVVLGGYVLEVENQADRTRIVAVQAPLGTGQEPRSKDLSEGRLVLDYAEFLDPEVYTKNRKITVAGELLGSSATEQDSRPFPYVHLHVTEIYLWPKEIVQPVYPYWDDWDYPIWYPWSWRRHPHPFWGW